MQQASNLENYLYLAVIAFGLAQSVIASSVFMIVTGIALGGGAGSAIRVDREYAPDRLGMGHNRRGSGACLDDSKSRGGNSRDKGVGCMIHYQREIP